MFLKLNMNMGGLGSSTPLRQGRKHWKALLLATLSFLTFLTAGVYARPIKSNTTLSISAVNKGQCCGTLAQRVSFLTTDNASLANLAVFSRSIIFKPDQAYFYMSHLLELSALSISFESSTPLAGVTWTPPPWSSEIMPGTPRLLMQDNLKSGTLYFEKIASASNQGIILEFSGATQIILNIQFSLTHAWLLGTQSYSADVTLSVELGPPV